jgi:hypothetical protein
MATPARATPHPRGRLEAPHPKGIRPMKPSLILGFVVGYILGSRAGRERYEDIVAFARRIAGSQTIQATAGVLQAQANEAAGRVKHRLASKIGHASHANGAMVSDANGHRSH